MLKPEPKARFVYEIYIAAKAEAVGGLRRQQEMVDAYSPVLLPGAGLIIPKRIKAGIVAGGTHRVG